MTKSSFWRSRLSQPTLPCAAVHSLEGHSSPSRNFRNRSRYQRHLLTLANRASLRRVFQGSFIDKEKAEIVSLEDCAEIKVARGEVLRSPRYTRKFGFGDNL